MRTKVCGRELLGACACACESVEESYGCELQQNVCARRIFADKFKI